MDIKWKKWKSKVASVLFFIGVSLVIISVAITARQMIKSKSMCGHIQLHTTDDYQKQYVFTELMNERLYVYLTIANGTFINWDYLNRTNDCESSCDSVAIENDLSNMSPEEIERYLAQESDYNTTINTQNFSELTKKQMAESYLDNNKGDLNILYQISNNGKVMYSNMDKEYQFGNDLPNGYNYVMYYDGDKVHVVKDEKVIDVYGNGIYNENNLYSVPGYSNYVADSSLKNVTVTLIAIKTPLEYRVVGGKNEYCYYGNTYSLYKDMIDFNNDWKKAIISGIIGIILLILTAIMRHRNPEYKKNLANFLNKVWIEAKILLILITASLAIHSIAATNDWYFYGGNWGYYYEEWGSDLDRISEIMQDFLSITFINSIFIVFIFWIIYLFIFDIIHNHKKKQNGFILKLMRGFDNRNLTLNFTRRQIRRVTLLLLCTIIAYILFIGCIILISNGQEESSILFFIVATLLLIFIFTWYCRVIRSQANDLEMLNNQIEKISQGNYVPEKMPFSGVDFIKTEENLLRIQSGMKNAVDQQLRSERMKVDLVANVSHDLKTPLTSIISYIDFLKEEDSLPDHVKDYIRILDEKSKRLNEMVQDVFSISKATSGQLPVKMEVLDFGKLLNQTLADLEETISQSNVSIKSNVIEHEFYIEADGQRMYRVCQNLIQNALKYSLEGSRMFISLELVQNKAVATFKNTSRDELNQDTDFTARFVRGDRSRTDGGSGLGLSIAQSFTEACGGCFTIDINGDMFVVTIAFDKHSSNE